MIITILKKHKILIADFQKIINKTSNPEDKETVDMIGRFLENIEKSSWMLDASTKK